MVERDFNAIKLGTEVVSLEQDISRIEYAAAPIVRRLIESETAAILSNDDKKSLSLFVALQLIRGTGHRAQHLDLAKKIRQSLIERGLPEDDTKFAVPDDHSIKLQSLHAIVNTLPEYLVHLQNKDMLIFKASPGHEFVIGDNPVVLDNQKSFGFRGNLGLALEGIEVYLPLSKNLTLGMWAKDLKSELREMIADVRGRQQQMKGRAVLGLGARQASAKLEMADLDDHIANANKLLQEVEASGPVHAYPENMDRFNSMQIGYAERYIASAGAKFELAKRMVAEMPEIGRQGARGSVS
jgi:hypothetical protein